MGIHFMGEPPFPDVYLHSLVTDEHGHKMSKTRGNVLDPLEIMDEFGTDALRMTVTASLSEGRNVRVSPDRVQGFRNFINKLWNVARFAEMNLHEDDRPLSREEQTELDLSLADRWILGTTREALPELESALGNYRFGDYAMGGYHLVWDQLCDWYVEWIKDDLREGRESSRRTLLTVLDLVTRALHPVIPFVTEEIRDTLPGLQGLTMAAAFPSADEIEAQEQAMAQAQTLMDAVTALRRTRTELGVPPRARPEVVLTGETSDSLLENVSGLRLLAGLGEVRGGQPPDGSSLAAAATLSNGTAWILLDGVLNLDDERERLQREIGRAQKELDKVQKKLSNPNFTSRAPEEVVAKQRGIASELEQQMAGHQAALDRLQALEDRS